MAYVDCLLFFGEDTEVTRVFKVIQAQVLLRPTGELLIGHTISLLGRQLTHKGEYIEITLGDKYMNNLLEEQDMHNSRPVNTPGTAALKTTTDETALTPDEHKHYRRAVGKLQWMTYTGPDICYATKELGRDPTAPTARSLQKLKHLLRYLQGTRRLNYIVRPASMPTQTEIQIDVYTDADWAGCPATCKCTTGVVIQVAGNTVHFGSQTQSVVAVSSAKSAELYAIGTGATEALHVKNFLQEATSNTKVTASIHTDSTSGKSIATRIRSSKKAKHIELKHLFIQQLVHNSILTIHQVGTLDNLEDVRTKNVGADTLRRHLYGGGLHGQH